MSLVYIFYVRSKLYSYNICLTRSLDHIRGNIVWKLLELEVWKIIWQSKVSLLEDWLTYFKKFIERYFLWTYPGAWVDLTGPESQCSHSLLYLLRAFCSQFCFLSFCRLLPLSLYYSNTSVWTLHPPRL